MESEGSDPGNSFGEPGCGARFSRGGLADELQLTDTAGLWGRVCGVRSLRLHAESTESDPSDSKFGVWKK